MPQIHLQCCIEERGFPVECWSDHRKNTPYPASLVVTRDVEFAWKHVTVLQNLSIAHNLMYAPDGRIYVFARLHQGCYPLMNFSTGIAGVELAGNIVLTTEDAFGYLTEQVLYNLLDATRA